MPGKILAAFCKILARSPTWDVLLHLLPTIAMGHQLLGWDLGLDIKLFSRYILNVHVLEPGASDEGPMLETLDLLSVLAVHRLFYTLICIYMYIIIYKSKYKKVGVLPIRLVKFNFSREMLNFAICIGRTSTFVYFDLYLYSAHYFIHYMASLGFKCMKQY